MKVVSATEAKNRLGALMNEVDSTGEPIMIELRGHPHMALISAETLERYEELDRRERGRQALAILDQIRERVGNRNADLTAEEADELAVRAVKEARVEMRRRRELQFESE